MSNMEKVRWGILGTAEIAELQLIPAILQSKNGEVAAISSRSGGGRAQVLAEKFAIPEVYSSYEDLLISEDIDAVYVPLPNELHAEWTKKAASYNKHVLCEKPAGLTAEQVKDMVQTCKKHDVIFMEAMMYQFHPQHKLVKELLDSGRIGEVKMMRASFTFTLQKWKGNFRLAPQTSGGGSIYDIGCYTIHAIRKVLGEPIKVLYVNETLTENSETDIAAIGVFEHEKGIKSYFDCGMNMSRRNEYEIIGTNGTIRVPNAFIPTKDGEGIVQVISNDGSISAEKVIANYYVEGVEYFSQHVLEKKELVAHAEETINNIQAVESVLNWRKMNTFS